MPLATYNYASRSCRVVHSLGAGDLSRTACNCRKAEASLDRDGLDGSGMSLAELGGMLASVVRRLTGDGPTEDCACA
jgi:hypothetical protein